MSDLVEHLRKELARYTYRANWALSIEPNGAGSLELVVRMTAIDSRNPGRGIVVSSGQPVPPILCGRQWDAGHSWQHEFERWLRRALDKVERHEAQEWFRRDGELVDDPHAQGNHL